jgi:hypothetical protein
VAGLINESVSTAAPDGAGAVFLAPLEKQQFKSFCPVADKLL